MTNGNGKRFSAEGWNNITISIVVVILVVAWAYKFVVGADGEGSVDATMFERVLIFVLGVAFGGQIAKKGVEQGTTAALTPAPPPGTTTTTVTAGPPPAISTEVKP